MRELDTLLNDLVIANRILSNENIVDAYGHVSVRHPEDPSRFFLARSLSPDLVERADIMEFTLDGDPINDDRTPYHERFIHSAIYEARPDVRAVVHAHAEDVLPFSIAADTPLKPVIHSGSFIGVQVPVWDIADNFGDTDLLVRNQAHGRDLARSLDGHNVALMRGHGFAAAAKNLAEVVRTAIYLPRNARAQFAAIQLGNYKALSPGEIAARASSYKPGQLWRAWEYWAHRAKCGHLLVRWPGLTAGDTK
jgi:HCOMODA/2-hydroxy-3-carboxy-muconic semialdehyde decarboxylase